MISQNNSVLSGVAAAADPEETIDSNNPNRK